MTRYLIGAAAAVALLAFAYILGRTHDDTAQRRLDAAKERDAIQRGINDASDDDLADRISGGLY